MTIGQTIETRFGPMTIQAIDMRITYDCGKPVQTPWLDCIQKDESGAILRVVAWPEYFQEAADGQQKA